MKKILLDTNLLIYREDHKIIDEKVSKLTKILYDSNEYKLMVHPLSIEDISSMKDEEEKEIFLSKINVYKKIDNPPKADDSFHSIVGCNRIPNDIIDNNLLFAVYRNCVDYLITNDIKLKNKGKKINFDNRVLSIDEAIELFSPEVKKESRYPVFIQKDYLYTIDINDTFFDSLKEDYLGFEEWYGKKSLKGEKAYITRYEDGIGAFLMLKVEDENEDYSGFEHSLSKKKRLKISTFKVADTGKKIGESFIKLIINEAKIENLDEIYVTVFDKQNFLIDLLKEYGFEKYTTKETKRRSGEIVLENIMVKNLYDEFYPNVITENKRFFIVPIQQTFHEKLFPESEQSLQLTLEHLVGINTYSNAIKKAYICNSNITKIRPGDILLFYASGDKKGITSIGVVDAVFNDFANAKDLLNMAKKRTVYSLSELEELFKKKTKLIMFKHFISLKNHINYSELEKEKILNGPPQTIKEINIDGYYKIINNNIL